MCFLVWCSMVSVMNIMISTAHGDTSTFTLADSLMPPGLPVAIETATSSPLVTEVERQGRVRGPFLNPRGRFPALRIPRPRALFQPPPPLPPQPLFNHLNDLTNELEVNPSLRKVLKDISMADLPLAGEGENQLPGFFAPEFNNRFTPDEDAPIVPEPGTTPRLLAAQQTTTQLTNQLPLADSQEPRPLFPPFGLEPQEPRPLFPPFEPEPSATQFTNFHVEHTTSVAPVIPPENLNQQFSSIVPETLRSIFPSFGDANFGSQFPPVLPDLSSPTTPENINAGLTEQFTTNSDQTINQELVNPFNQELQDQELLNPFNQGFQVQESLELSNEFPTRPNNNQALEEDDFFHISGLRPPTGHLSHVVIHSAGQNRRPPKTVLKPHSNDAIRNPNKNRGQFVPNNNRNPRQLQRRPQQLPPRGLRNNNAGRPIDHRRQRTRSTPSGESFNEINIDLSIENDIRFKYKPIVSRKKRQVNNWRRKSNTRYYRRHRNQRQPQIRATFSGEPLNETHLIVSNPLRSRARSKHQSEQDVNDKVNPVTLAKSKKLIEEYKSLKGFGIIGTGHQINSKPKQYEDRKSTGFLPNKPLPDIEFDIPDFHDKVPDGLPQSLSSFTKAQLNTNRFKGTKGVSSNKGSMGNNNFGNMGKVKKRKRMSLLEAAIRKNLMRPNLYRNARRNIQKGLGVVANRVNAVAKTVGKATGEVLGSAVVAAGEGLEAVSGHLDGDQGGYLDLNHGTRSISSGLKLTVPHHGHVTEHKFGLQLKVSLPPSGGGFALPEVGVGLDTGTQRVPLKYGNEPPHAFLEPFTEIKNINNQQNHQIPEKNPHNPSFDYPPSSSFGPVNEFPHLHHSNGFVSEIPDFGTFIESSFGSSFDSAHDGVYNSHEHISDIYSSTPQDYAHINHQHHNIPQHHTSQHNLHSPQHFYHNPPSPNHRPSLPPCKPPLPRPPGLQPIPVVSSFNHKHPIAPCKPLHRRPPPPNHPAGLSPIPISSPLRTKPRIRSHHKELPVTNYEHPHNIQDIKTIIQDPTYPGDYFRNPHSGYSSELNKSKNNSHRYSQYNQRDRTNGSHSKGFDIDKAIIPFGDMYGNIDFLRHTIINNEQSFLNHNSPSVDVERRRSFHK